MLIAQGLGTLAVLPESSLEAPLPFPIVLLSIASEAWVLLTSSFDPLTHKPCPLLRGEVMGGSQDP